MCAQRGIMPTSPVVHRRYPVGRNSKTSIRTVKADDVDVRTRQRTRPRGSRRPEEQATEHRAAQVADTAEHCGGERLEGRREPHRVDHADREREEETGRSAQEATEHEGQRNDRGRY